LVEPVHGRQELVAVAEMVLAELACGVAERLECFGDGDVPGLEAKRGRGQANLGHAGAQASLSGDERRATCRAALLGVIVSEHDPFAADTINVWRLVAHDAE